VSTGLDISLPGFEGPLDLLLSLVRKNEVDIADIPIAEITRQYLDYLRRAEELNIDLGSEFVYMAALLIHIKSRCLLPGDPEVTAREDPRQELVRQLVDHEQVRQAAEFLKQKLELAEASWFRASMEEFRAPAEEEWTAGGGDLNLLQVLRLAQQALAAARTYELITPAGSVDVAEMMGWLEERLAGNLPLEAGALLAEQPDAPHRTALFLGMLEMAKASRIGLEQQECFGPILIHELAGNPC
jgi:segregation and condensation protein A